MEGTPRYLTGSSEKYGGRYDWHLTVHIVRGYAIEPVTSKEQETNNIRCNGFMILYCLQQVASGSDVSTEHIIGVELFMCTSFE